MKKKKVGTFLALTSILSHFNKSFTISIFFFATAMCNAVSLNENENRMNIIYKFH